MDALAKTYNPAETEQKWYAYWMKKNYFHSEPDHREPYTILIPPPNVTGVLHMGHMLNNTIQDVLIRKARMEGKNACWVPGTDHASIATEAKVVAKLREEGIKKSDLTREVFLEHAWAWKEKYGGIILEQLKKLGASCDWERTRFTMEPDLTDAVLDVFVDLHDKGFIYRGLRMVNWDPQGLTAVSDEEVIYKEVQSTLYYVNYAVVGADGQFVTIATTRPETILADTAVCIHPNDERYTHLHGKFVKVPFTDREIPIILDEYVTMEFGTGCLKVTPAHDVNDYELGLKHNLPVIDMLTADGNMAAEAGVYAGMDRFAARKKIGKDLEEAGYITKTEHYTNQVGYSERTNAVIEPRLSLQWFVNMKAFIQKNPQVVDAVMSDEIQFHPAKFKNTYRHWMDNIKDWCISRQLWWGQRIPAWYLPNGDVVVCRTKEEAITRLQPESKGFTAADMYQDEDVLDTWFSSWLWPISVFDGFKEKGNPEVSYYYPTNDLVTAPEIMFFWVARMIMAGYEYMGKLPFKNVYYTGIVRDKQGRKMSKSLGNSPDPLALIDKYSADGVRVGMLLSSPAGNDLLFDELLCEQGRNFANKIWNAYRLVSGWQVDESLETPQANYMAITWFESRFTEQLQHINEHYAKYRMSDALMATYKLVWDDFCAWYLEMIKPGYEQPIDQATYTATIRLFSELLKVLHPFMPFITEELWHAMAQRAEGDDIIVAPWPKGYAFQEQVQGGFKIAAEMITQVRNFRKSKNVSPKEALPLMVKGDLDAQWTGIISKLANLTSITRVTEQPAQSYGFVIESLEGFVPFTENIDIEAETKRLKEELTYQEGFLKSVAAKLANERFVQNAKPDVVAAEQKKQADALTKIKAIREQLEALGVTF